MPMPTKRKEEAISNDNETGGGGGDDSSVNSSSNSSTTSAMLNNTNNNSATLTRNSKRARTNTRQNTDETPTESAPTTTTTDHMQTTAQEIYDALRSVRGQGEPPQRVASDAFLKLPSKRTHPDYYACVKEPIDFLQIQAKLKAAKYDSLSAFRGDVQLLLANAKAFYGGNYGGNKKNAEYTDACALSEALAAEMAKRGITTPPSPQQQQQQNTRATPSGDSSDNESESNHNTSASVDGDTKPPTAATTTSSTTANANTIRRSRRSLRAPSSGGGGTGANESFNSSEHSLNTGADEPPQQTTTTTAKKTDRSTRNKSTNAGADATSDTHLTVYLEEFFDTMCSFQDETQRFVASVFYLLPSAKVLKQYRQIRDAQSFCSLY